jgi:hypothetical protein
VRGRLDDLFLGNESIQRSKFDEVNTAGFVMDEGKTAKDMYQRLTTLAVQMRDVGASYVMTHG